MRVLAHSHQYIAVLRMYHHNYLPSIPQYAKLRTYLAVPGLKWGAAAFAVYVVYDMLASGGKKEKHH